MHGIEMDMFTVRKFFANFMLKSLRKKSLFKNYWYEYSTYLRWSCEGKTCKMGLMKGWKIQCRWFFNDLHFNYA